MHGHAEGRRPFAGRWARAVFFVLVISLLVFSSSAARNPASRVYSATFAPSRAQADPVIAGAGDIACPSDIPTDRTCHQRATSDLLVAMNPTAVFNAGDDQYESGTLSAFLSYYGPTWGRLKAITHPVAGNHEYLTPGAAGYFDYFGPAAGDRSKGYYSLEVGAWHLIVLNSNCGELPAGTGADGCDEGSPQNDWLEQDLAASTSLCTLALWHHPRFSSGVHGNDTSMGSFWDDLYASGADVVINGHDHDYERFAPQDPAGGFDPASGIREFVVGTGGRHYDPWGIPQPNSQRRNRITYGVLKLTLHGSSYDWEFVPEAGQTFTDRGRSACH